MYPCEDSCELEGYMAVGVIGHGSTCCVHLAERTCDGKLVCVKKVRDGSPNIDREIENFRRCNHENIPQLIEVIRKNGWVYIVMEYVRGGCLSKWIMTGPASESFMHRVFRQLIDALEYLHTECRMIHRDVKLENVMLDDDLNVKLIDFGFSKELQEETHRGTACGSPAYVAPEIVKREDYGFPADVWAAGVVLYIMAVGKFPFSDVSVPGLLKKIVTEDLTFPDDLVIDRDLSRLLVGMLDKNPITRLTISEIKESRWMRKMNGNGMIGTTQSLNGIQFGKRQVPARGSALAPLRPRPVRRKMTNPQIAPPVLPENAHTGRLNKVAAFRQAPVRPMGLPCNILSEKRKSFITPGIPVPI